MTFLRSLFLFPVSAYDIQGVFAVFFFEGFCFLIDFDLQVGSGVVVIGFEGVFQLGAEGFAGFGVFDEFVFLIKDISPPFFVQVAIARALALHPDILCFDEPTSALDPELTGEVLKVLRDLADRKTTMIIVTHEMHFARDVADRIMFMDGGVVVEEGPARQLIEHPQEERTKQFLAHYSE